MRLFSNFERSESPRKTVSRNDSCGGEHLYLESNAKKIYCVKTLDVLPITTLFTQQHYHHQYQRHHKQAQQQQHHRIIIDDKLQYTNSCFLVVRYSSQLVYVFHLYLRSCFAARVKVALLYTQDFSYT